uniref:Uncharacterized protein n=1 Tax=Romanomermis culicivorax TaxID=13658 RepID=A0A915HSR9_ROMCU
MELEWEQGCRTQDLTEYIRFSDKERGCDPLGSWAMGVGDQEAILDYFLLTGVVRNLARMSDRTNLSKGPWTPIIELAILSILMFCLPISSSFRLISNRKSSNRL